MKGMRGIPPTGVRLPDELKEKLQERAAKNGRSLNSEIVMMLQSVIDEELQPKKIDELAQLEADKFKAALLETLKKMSHE
ncbi:Arc family DNA-binding protein [Xenorhabdus sp. KK7.4]|uniref:Arc family DNA-binding protein n=1 Tax=Xenorhabdus sp. KK7.4 TaxID=1851572 RepID=UPI000C044328|nr:Arc family DNA-binding protein [Xenorhabdus sp. KK7.4]PHM57022.1 Rha family transcriptional regulator [Xenorhabdus sp. KK7.4]